MQYYTGIHVHVAHLDINLVFPKYTCTLYLIYVIAALVCEHHVCRYIYTYEILNQFYSEVRKHFKTIPF